MSFACGIWCLADASSVSPSSEQTQWRSGAHIRFLAVSEVGIFRTGLKLMLFDISLFILFPPSRTLYKHIVAVKATIDKQSPHGKLLFKDRSLLSMECTGTGNIDSRS